MKKYEKAVRELAVQLLEEDKNNRQYSNFCEYMNELYECQATDLKEDGDKVNSYDVWYKLNEADYGAIWVDNKVDEINEKLIKLQQYIGLGTKISKNIKCLDIEGVKRAVAAWDRIEDKKNDEIRRDNISKRPDFVRFEKFGSKTLCVMKVRYFGETEDREVWRESMFA